MRPWLVVTPGGGTAAPQASWPQPSSANNFPSATQIPRPQILCASRSSTLLRPLRGAGQPVHRPTDHNKDAMGATLVTPQGEITMANIGTFTAQNDGFTGTVRTLTLNVKVKFVPNDRSSRERPELPHPGGRRLRHRRGLEESQPRPSGPTCP